MEAKSDRVLSRLLKEQPSPTLTSTKKTSYKFMQINAAETTYLPHGRLVVGFFT